MSDQSHSPLVSVIVPVYNVESYLERCVVSIIKQSYPNLQIILIDDGSTDSSGALCDELKERDERITVIHTENHGLSGARNTGLAAASGDYLLYVDSDDFVGEDHVMNLLSAAIGTNSDVAATGPTFIPESAHLPDLAGVTPTSYELLDPVDAACVALATPSSLFAEHAWGKLFAAPLAPLLVFPEGKHFEDQFVMYKVLCAANQVVYENSEDYYYIVSRSSSITNQHGEKHLDTIEARQEIIRFAQERNLPKLEALATKRYYARLIGEFAIFCLGDQRSLADRLYERIIAERAAALASPYLAPTTKAAFLLSFLPRKLFEMAACASERRCMEIERQHAQHDLERVERSLA